MFIKDKFVWVLFMAVLFETFFLSFDFVHKYNNFALYNVEDLSDHVQIAWNTGKGRLFLLNKVAHSGVSGVIEINAFFGHFQPIYLFIGLWYSIFPHPLSVVSLQTFFVLLGAIPVYLIADNLLKDKISAMVFSIIYLTYSPLFVVMQYFHAEYISMPFIFFAFYYFQTKNFRMFILSSILAMSCREEVALIILMFGACAFIKKMDRIWIAVPLLMGTSWFMVFLAVKWTTQWYYSDYDMPQVVFSQNFGYLGGNLFEITKTIISNPLIIYDQISSPRTVDIIKGLLSPLYYLPLLSPSTLFIGSISFSEILLSNNPVMGNLSGQPWYLCWNIPVIIVAVIYAANNLNKFATYILPSLENGSGFIGLVSISIFIAIIVTDQSKPITPYVKNFLNDQFWSLNDELKDTWNIIKGVPKEASVMTDLKLLPPLSARRLRMSANHFGKGRIAQKKQYNYMLLIRDKEDNKRALDYMANSSDYRAVLYNDVYALYRSPGSQGDDFVDWRKKAAAYILENIENKSLVAVDNWETLKAIISFLCALEDNTRYSVISGYEKSKEILDQYFAELCSKESINLIKNGSFEAEHELEGTPAEGWSIAPSITSASRNAKFGETALFLQPKDYLQSVGYKIRTDNTDFTNSRVSFGVWARSEDIFKIVSLRLLLHNPEQDPEQGWRAYPQTFRRVSPEWKFYFITAQFDPSFTVKHLYAYVTPSNLLNGESFNEIYIDGMTAVKGLWTDYMPLTIQVGMKQISFMLVKEETKYLEELLNKYKKVFFVSEMDALPHNLRKYFRGKTDILTGAKSRKMSGNTNWLNWINVRLPADLQITRPTLYEIGSEPLPGL